MEQNSYNCKSTSIRHPTSCSYLKYDNTNDLILLGDNKGLVSLYDIRANKAIKIINNKIKSEIKYKLLIIVTLILVIM